MSRIYKLISLVVAITFLGQEVSWAAPSFSIQRPAIADRGTPICNPKSIFIPEQYGTIEGANRRDIPIISGSGERTGYPDNIGVGQTVILIKDAHCHYEAQRNIAKILDILIKDYQIDLVCVEGAGGKVDPSVIAGSPDDKRRKEVADEYLKKGYLTSSEVLAMERGKDYGFSIWGVEDLKLYLEDLKAFREVYSGSTSAGRFIEISKNLISNLKNRLYPKDALAFDKKIQDYKDNKLSLTGLIEYLHAIDKEKFTLNLRLVLKALILEKATNFSKVENERALIIKSIENRHPKEDIQALVKNSLLYKLGKLSSLDYYSYLKRFILPSEYENYPNLLRYIQIIKIHSRIEEDDLFKELDALIESIYKIYIKDEISVKLHIIDGYINLLDKLSRLEITRDELERYRKSDINLSDAVNFIKIQTGADIDIPDELTKQPEEFYRYALERDDALVSNLIKRMGEEGKDKAIIIIGGFHAEGVEKLLKEKNVQVITITPSITKEDTEAKKIYLSRMLDERIQPDEMIKQLGLMNLGTQQITGIEWKDKFSEIINTIENATIKGRLKGAIKEGIDAEQLRAVLRAAIQAIELEEQIDDADRVKIGVLKRMLGEGDVEVPSVEAEKAPSVPGGLIGKYEMVENSEPEFDQQRGVIKIRVRDIFRPDEPPKEICLEAVGVDKQKILTMLQELNGENEVVDGIIKWFETSFNGRLFVLADGANEGILGFGSRGMIGLNIGLSDEPLSWFHEIAHSAIKNESVSANGILESSGDKGRLWFNKHLAKGHRDNLREHYAIRALQRAVFTDADRELTSKIQKLLLKGLFVPNSPALNEAMEKAVVYRGEENIRVFQNGGLNKTFMEYLKEDFEIVSAYYFKPEDLGVPEEEKESNVKFYIITDKNANKYIIQVDTASGNIVNVAVHSSGGYFIYVEGVEAVVQEKWDSSSVPKDQVNTTGEYLYTAAFTEGDVAEMVEQISSNPILRYLYKNVFERYGGLRLAGGLYLTREIDRGGYYIPWLNLILWRGIGAPSSGLLGHETSHHLFHHREEELYEIGKVYFGNNHRNFLKFLKNHPSYGGWYIPLETLPQPDLKWDLDCLPAIEESFAHLVQAVIEKRIEIWRYSYDYVRYGDIKFFVDLGLLPEDYFISEILELFKGHEIASYGFYDLIEETYRTRFEGKGIDERLMGIADREFSKKEGMNKRLIYTIGDCLRRKGNLSSAKGVFNRLLGLEGLGEDVKIGCLVQLGEISREGGDERERDRVHGELYGLLCNSSNLDSFLEFVKGASLSGEFFGEVILWLDNTEEGRIKGLIRGAIERKKTESFKPYKDIYEAKEKLLFLYKALGITDEIGKLEKEMEGILDNFFRKWGERGRKDSQRRRGKTHIKKDTYGTYNYRLCTSKGTGILSVVLGGLIIAFSLKAFALGKYLTFAYISTGYLNILMIVLAVITFGAIIFLVVAAKPEAPSAKRLVISPEEEDRVCKLLLEGKTEELGDDFVGKLDELERQGSIRFKKINIGEPVLTWETVPGFPNSTLPIQGERPWADLEKLNMGTVLRITIRRSGSLEEVRLLRLDKVFVRNNGQYKEILIKGKERDFSFTYALSQVQRDRGRIVYLEPFFEDGSTSTTSFTIEALAEVHAPDKFGQGEAESSSSGGLRGARKNIVDTDYVQVGEGDLRSVIESAGRVEEKVGEWIDGTTYGYSLVYYSSGELEQTNKLKKTGGGYNCVLDGKTYVFVDLDAKDTGIAEEHEVFEIYWKNWIRKNKPDLHGMDITRAAHILAWGQQIIKRGWTSASECSFIIEQLEGMTLEQLENIINEDREEHKKIQRILLEVEGIEESDLEVIRKFEASVRELAKERHLEREGLFRGVPIPVGEREVAPFSDKEEAEKKLAEIKGIREEGKPVNNTVLQDLYRLACTFTGVKDLDKDIRNELYKWVMSCTDERVIASIIVGWALVKDGQGRTWGQLRDKLRERYGRGKGGAIRMLYDMAKKSVYQGFTLGSIARRGPPPSYEEQLKSRNIYGQIEGKWVNRDNIPNRVRTINVKGLKAWLTGHLHEKTGGEGKVVSIIPYGSYLYGFRTTPSDLDVLVIVDEVSTDKLPKKIKGEVSIDDTTRRLLFNQAEYVRSTTSADVTFITVEQLLGTAQTVTKVINAGIVLQGEGLVDFYVGPSPKINCLAWAEQLATEGRRLATEITDEIDTSVWRAKSMRWLLEANLLIYRIDPSVAVPQEKVDAVIEDVVKYLDGGVKLDRINEELIELHGLISRALIHARISLVWQNLEELRTKREHVGGEKPEQAVIRGTKGGTGEGLQGPQEPAIETEDMGKAGMGEEEIHIISKVIVEKVREKFESITEYSIYQGALGNYWSQFVFMLEDFIKKQGVGLDEESLLVRKVAERIETMLGLKHGEIIVSFTKEEFGAIKEQIVDEIGRQKDERAAEKERREGERRKKEECWKDNKEEIKGQVGSFIKYLEDKEGSLVDKIYEKLRVIPAMESDSPETIKGWIHEILGSIRKQISKDLETFVGGGDWSNAGVFHSLIELYYYNDGTIPIPEVISKCIERVAIGIELEKGLEVGTIVEPSSDNIGKGVEFTKSGDKLIIKLPNGSEVEVGIRKLTTGIDSLKENLKEKVRQLNASELGEDFIKMFDNLQVMVFTGTPETQAAGAFASVDENGVVSLDEVLLETEAGDMTIIHEVIHAFLKGMSGKDLKDRIEGPMAEKILEKAGDDSALLRHYYARYYLQNPKDSAEGYAGSPNEILTYEIRLAAVAGMLEIDRNVLRSKLNTLGAEKGTRTLRDQLLKLIKTDGKITEDEMQAIFRSAEKVVEALSFIKDVLPRKVKRNIDKIRELLTIYVVINGINRQERAQIKTDVINNLIERLSDEGIRGIEDDVLKVIVEYILIKLELLCNRDGDDYTLLVMPLLESPKVSRKVKGIIRSYRQDKSDISQLPTVMNAPPGGPQFDEPLLPEDKEEKGILRGIIESVVTYLSLKWEECRIFIVGFLVGFVIVGGVAGYSYFTYRSEVESPGRANVVQVSSTESSTPVSQTPGATQSQKTLLDKLKEKIKNKKLLDFYNDAGYLEQVQIIGLLIDLYTKGEYEEEIEDFFRQNDLVDFSSLSNVSDFEEVIKIIYNSFKKFNIEELKKKFAGEYRSSLYRLAASFVLAEEEPEFLQKVYDDKNRDIFTRTMAMLGLIRDLSKAKAKEFIDPNTLVKRFITPLVEKMVKEKDDDLYNLYIGLLYLINLYYPYDPIDISQLSHEEQFYVLMMQRIASARQLKNMERLQRVWMHKEFQDRTSTLSPFEKFSLARQLYFNIPKGLKKSELGQYIKDRLGAYKEAFQKVKERVVLGQGSNVLIIGHPDFAEAQDTYLGMLETYIISNTKEEILDNIKGSSNNTIIFNVHADEGVLEFNDTDNGTISYQELAGALIDGIPSKDFSGITIIIDGCYAPHFIANFLSYMLEQGVSLENLPIVIGASGIGEMASGSIFALSLDVILKQKGLDSVITCGDILGVKGWFSPYQEFTIFFPPAKSGIYQKRTPKSRDSGDSRVQRRVIRWPKGVIFAGTEWSWQGAIGKIYKHLCIMNLDPDQGKAVLKAYNTRTRRKENIHLTISPMQLNIGGIAKDDECRQIVDEILSASTGIKLYQYEELYEDLFGFASYVKDTPDRSLIALHKSLVSNPIAIFHEIGEYLIKMQNLKLKIQNDRLVITVKGKEYNLILDEEALAIARKDPEDPHYLLRALQRQLFGKRDRDLTAIIKAEQFLRGIAQDKWNEVIKKEALLAAKSLYLAGVFTKGSLDDMKNLFETITENAGKPVRIADAFIGLKELAEAVNSINDDIREEVRDVVLNIRLLTLIAKNHGGVTENVYWILKELVLIINSMDIEGRKEICNSVLNLDLLMKIAADSENGFYRYGLFYNFIKETTRMPPSVYKIILSRTLLEEIAVNIRNADIAYNALKTLAEKGVLNDSDLVLLIKIARTGAVTIFKALQICADKIAVQKELLQIFNVILEQDEKDILTAYLMCLIYDGEDFEAIRTKIEGVVKERDIRGAVLHNLEVMAKNYYSSRKGLNAGDVVKTDLDLLVNNIYALVLFYRVSRKVFRTNSVFDAILMKIILRSNIHADYEAANSDFIFGRKFISKINVDVLFMVTVHEIMHNVLSEQGVETEKDPEKASIHEFLSDIAAFSMAVYMGGNIDEFKEVVKYADMLKAAEIFGDKPLGGHIPARAQLGKLFIWFKEINAERRRGGKEPISLGLHWKDILEIGVDIIIANKDFKFNELVRQILKRFGDFLKSQKEIGPADVRGKGPPSSIIPPSSITKQGGESHDLGVQILGDSEFPRQFISLISKVYKRLRIVKKEDMSLVLEGYNTRTKKMERLTLGITPAGIKKEEIMGLLEDKDCRNLVEAIILCANQDIVSYQELHEDLFGFASSKYNLIALHKTLADEPIAVFHEIGHYLVDSGRLEMRLEGNVLIVSVNGKGYNLILNEEVLAIARKDPEDPHYLLRALQRQVFGKRDRDLTAIIKAEQLIRDIEELHGLDESRRRELVERISDILDKIRNGMAIEEDELKIDVNILLESDLDNKFEIVTRIAKFVTTVVPKDYKGNKGIIVVAIEAELIEVLREVKKGVEEDERELIDLMKELAKQNGIAPDLITNIYDVINLGFHLIAVDIRMDRLEVDPAYRRIIDKIALITGIDRNKIADAFAIGSAKGYVKAKYGEDIGKADLGSPNAMAKDYLRDAQEIYERLQYDKLGEPVGIEGQIGSSLSKVVERLERYSSVRQEDAYVDLDMQELGVIGDFYDNTTVRANSVGNNGVVYKNNSRYYLSTYDVEKEDVDKLWGAVPKERRELIKPTVVAADVRRFLGDIKRKGKVIEIIQNSVGIRYVLEKAGENGYVALYGCGEDMSIIREAIDRAMPRKIADRIILLNEKPDAQNITTLGTEIQGKVKGANILWTLAPDMAGGVVNGNREAVVNNQLRVVGVDAGSTFHAELLFGFLYAGIDLFKDKEIDRDMIDTLLHLLNILGCENLDDIRDDLLKGALYFTVRLIRIKETLEEFQNRRITIEVAA